MHYLKLFISWLPQSFQIRIAKLYYSQLLVSIDESKEPDFKVVKYLVSPGDYVVDVGANIGIYTRYLADLVGLDGHVESFEPFPYTFDILNANIKYLGLHQVFLHNCALSDYEGNLSMEVPINESGFKNYYRVQIKTNQSVENDRNSTSVQSQTLDKVFANLKSIITFIKIDVEGHELSVIRGADTILTNFRPALLVEVSGDPDNPNSEANILFNYLFSKEYQVFYFNGTHLRKRLPNDISINYFFLTKNHLNNVTHLLEI